MSDSPNPTRLPLPHPGSSEALDAPSNPLRSYHVFLLLFVLLAVLVIVASVVTQHMTAEAFNRVVEQTDGVIRSQVWLDELSRSLLEVNAAGNNIFKSQDVPTERGNFRMHLAELRGHVGGLSSDFLNRPSFERHMDDMVEAEQHIFDCFDELSCAPIGSEAEETLLAEAAHSMAEMDAAQARAMEVLGHARRVLRQRQQAIQDEGKQVLSERWLRELMFLGSIAVFLGAGYALWRQFQRVHEQVELARRRVEAERKNRLAAVGEVCFSVAHGIKNPVAAIASSAQLVLEYGQLDDASKERVRDLYVVTRSLSDRVTQLLNFSRVGELQRVRLEPRDVIERALREIDSQLAAAGVSVVRRYEAGAAQIEGDRNILVQAVLELLGNAKDVLQGGGSVTVLCRVCDADAGLVELGVIDNGPGMSEDVKRRAFELFFTRKPKGSGVGLATVKRAAELHNGAVVIADADPHGADIRIRLPRAERSAIASAPDAQA